MKRGAIGWVGALISVSLMLLLIGCGNQSASTSELSESGGSSGGTGITNTFSSPSEMGVGDIMPIEFGSETQMTVDFSGVGADANFILVVGSYNTSGVGDTIQLSQDMAAPVQDPLAKAMNVEAGDDGYGPNEILDAWLRASEAALPDTEVPTGSGAVGGFAKAMSVKAASVGSTETFRVLASLSSTTSYAEVTGEVRCVGTNVVFYVDTTVSSDILSDSDVQSLCSEFDAVAGAEESLLGSTSDVDGDGKLHVLMTKQINRLGAMGGGIITGYFYAGDLYARSGSNPVSNDREIIYTMVPDPDGSYGTAISKDFAWSNLLPAVLPHEMQHAISYNQHVFVNGGSPEDNWLNEGMSHLIEDVMGYGVENPARYGMYIASPSTYGIVTQGSPNLMERGASYLFMRFMYEQAADPSGFLRALENTSAHGVDNLEAAFNGSSGFSGFSEFMARWTVALAMTDRGVSQDSRYVYRARTRAATGNWEGVCLSCDADDNRGTTLDGVHLNTYYGGQTSSIDASAAMFFELTTLPTSLKLAGTQGGGSYGVLIRTQ